ncbi:hypothetical protein CDAR_33931 [Caerostris darwini]|uniref:Uncharacterized protein n=1 Tax=Caerostris darwini TaxID=1538125 RepID=A0AAV4UZ62_9ARAC|nr:hypothetical protein CDAR_33931 [Caerostris darwini]
MLKIIKLILIQPIITKEKQQQAEQLHPMELHLPQIFLHPSNKCQVAGEEHPSLPRNHSGIHPSRTSASEEFLIRGSQRKTRKTTQLRGMRCLSS